MKRMYHLDFEDFVETSDTVTLLKQGYVIGVVSKYDFNRLLKLLPKHKKMRMEKVRAEKVFGEAA